MNRSVLFVIDSDPRLNGRAAEAIRIAAGVSVWQKVDVTVYLRGPAVLALGEFPEELKDGENFRRHLPLLQEQNRPILVEAAEPFLKEVMASPVTFREVGTDELSILCRASHSVLHF